MSNLKKIAAAAIRDVETERDAQDALQDENGRWHSERDGHFAKRPSWPTARH